MAVDDFWDFLAGAEMSRARQFDASLRSREIVGSRTSIYLAYAELGRVAARLTELDRELRRASGILAPEAAAGVDSLFVAREAEGELRTAFLEKRRKGRGLPPPVPVERAGFEIEAAETGSFELSLEAIGVLGLVLSSEPVTTFLTTMSLLDRWARLRAWVRDRQKKDVMDRITGRELMQINEELRRERFPTLQPDLDIELDPHPPHVHRARPAMIRQQDGTLVVGRSITHITTNADGTETIIYVEG